MLANSGIWAPQSWHLSSNSVIALTDWKHCCGFPARRLFCPSRHLHQVNKRGKSLYLGQMHFTSHFSGHYKMRWPPKQGDNSDGLVEGMLEKEAKQEECKCAVSLFFEEACSAAILVGLSSTSCFSHVAQTATDRAQWGCCCGWSWQNSTLILHLRLNCPC